MARRGSIAIGLVSGLVTIAASSLPIAADDARVLAWGDPLVEDAESAFILAGRDPPLLVRPILAGKLRPALLALDGSPEAAGLAHELAPPRGSLVFNERVSLAGTWSGSPGRNELIATKAYSGLKSGFSEATASPPDAEFNAIGKQFLSSEAAGAALAVPPILDLRLQFLEGPLALDLNPVIRPATNWYREEESASLNALVLASPGRLDTNFPYRGIASFLEGPFEIRAGRDKLHLGPGRWQALSVNSNLPYLDFASASADFGPVTIGWYLIRLNPRLSDDEKAYLEALRKYPKLDYDKGSAYTYGVEAAESKQLVIGRLTWRVAPRATLAISQHDLVAGRNPQLSDLNPLIVFHNLFNDGSYAVPILVDASFVPAPGLRLYAQYYFYDATFGDETDSSNNAGASAYQLGFSALRPLRSGALAGSTLRFDLEGTYVDPWTYGKQLSLRQLTSRYIFVEPGYGRFWVDYPIGPSFGPDGWELDGRLALGFGRRGEAAVRLLYRERGSVDMLGYGGGSDYVDKASFKQRGLVVVREGEAPERRLELGLEGKLALGRAAGHAIDLRASGAIVSVEGYGFAPGKDRLWLDASIVISASLDPAIGK